MKGTVRTTTIKGVVYEVWSDFIDRATYAKNTETNEVKRIHSSGYIKNDLTVRKAIALVFKLPSYRK